MPATGRICAAAFCSVVLSAASVRADAPEKPRPAAADDEHPRVTLATNMGNIVLELDRKNAPITVANFLMYVDAKQFDGLIFHRVINDFMIQGGGYDADMKEKPTKDPIKNESANGLKNLRGTIAMARTAVPDSATAQFFINVKDNDFLDGGANKPGYAVFGKVVSGMDVVDKIKAVATRSVGGMDDVPREPIVIKSARRAEK